MKLLQKLKLPWWMSGPELNKLKTAAQQFFEDLLKVAHWPLDQLDARQADEGIVRLIAWQRGIDRFNNEGMEMFRLRVFHAYANARDAGSVIGFERIFQRLNLGYLEQAERLPDKDWDVIVLNVSDSATAQNPEFMNWLIQTYGRTCRRYEWNVITLLTLSIKPATFDWDQQTYIASLEAAPGGIAHG
ncbi:hypothetical protein CAPTEDRAFT_125546 [Capitella teleta]|uniref:Uncharacterized protein n=1 Tax=Capitella teleta TaxID=283909 RepID=R7V6U4_CAPTE|nr:hypothetical protein CAPTEDRAFT_125546 [Capitella teleta]|eukprot:ELU14279.1 hypothetical protein CAPTEDRAFT_125546 [Capitella teleta]